jgi:hypothetical protein
VHTSVIKSNEHSRQAKKTKNKKTKKQKNKKTKKQKSGFGHTKKTQKQKMNKVYKIYKETWIDGGYHSSSDEDYQNPEIDVGFFVTKEAAMKVYEDLESKSETGVQYTLEVISTYEDSVDTHCKRKVLKRTKRLYDSYDEEGFPKREDYY